MKIMPCPLNGPRNITEFICHGPVKAMPAPDAPAEAWADYAFFEDNSAGPVVEWWFHIPTAYWFIAERDTMTDEIIQTWTVDAFRGEGRL